jgi:acyl dehydratase
MADMRTTYPRGGIYFEDFEVGPVFRHRLTRTASQVEDLLFSSPTPNPRPLQIDARFCATETEWRRPQPTVAG